MRVEQLVEEINKIKIPRVGVYFEDEGQMFRAIHNAYIDSDGDLILQGVPLDED